VQPIQDLSCPCNNFRDAEIYQGIWTAAKKIVEDSTRTMPTPLMISRGVVEGALSRGETHALSD
jgi:hypothetical protein